MWLEHAACDPVTAKAASTIQAMRSRPHAFNIAIVIAAWYVLGSLLACTFAHLYATRDDRPMPGMVAVSGTGPFFLCTPLDTPEYNYLVVHGFTDVSMGARVDLRDFADRPLVDVLTLNGDIQLSPDITIPAEFASTDWLADRSAPVSSVAISCIGWPWRCLRATFINDPPRDFSTPPRWPIPAYRPLWPGLFADAAIFAIPLVGLSATFFGLRRFKRLRTGHCPNCNYDLSGQTISGCPECGWGRS